MNDDPCECDNAACRWCNPPLSEPLDLEAIKATIQRAPGSDRPNYAQLAALVAEVERLRAERDDLALAFAVHSGRRELWGLSDTQKAAITRAIALVAK